MKLVLVSVLNVLLLNTAATAVNKARDVTSECPIEDVVDYTAAVLEFEPQAVMTETGGAGVLSVNALRLTEYATIAAQQGVDIFVAPEYSLQSLEMHRDDPEVMISFTQVVPDPAVRAVPCDDPTDPLYIEAVRTLSCAARDLQMYLVIDLAEQAACEGLQCTTNSSVVFYNTQVVFDRSGAVVARYRKQNLYLEPQFEAGPADDTQALFETDFGVLFSLQICFDLVYEHPGYNNVNTAGVRDVVMSTAWVDEVPFLPAINAQNGWSRSVGANLIVSGYHWPERTKLGSGIYRAYSDLTNAYTYDPNSGDVLVVSPVRTCRTGTVVSKTSPVIEQPTVIQLGPRAERKHVMLHEDLSVYNRTILPPTTAEDGPSTVTLCSDDNYCCTANYQHYQSNLTYQLMAFSGMLIKGAGTYRVYCQVCSIVWCTDEDWQSCALVDQTLPQEDVFGPFTLTAEHSCEEVFTVAMTRNLTLVDNSEVLAGVEGSTYSLAIPEGVESMMSAALFGRWYSRDPGAAN